MKKGSEQLRNEALQIEYDEYLMLAMRVADIKYNILPFKDFVDSGVGDYITYKSSLLLRTMLEIVRNYCKGEEDDTERSDPEVH